MNTKLKTVRTAVTAGLKPGELHKCIVFHFFCYQLTFCDDLKGRDHFGGIGIDENVMLKWLLQKQNVVSCIKLYIDLFI
jgi:hypothetical protein